MFTDAVVITVPIFQIIYVYSIQNTLNSATTTLGGPAYIKYFGNLRVENIAPI